MAQAAKGAGFNSAELRQQHAQLHNQIRAMQEEHHRFMQGLREEQRAAMREHMREMERAQERVQTRLREMDEELKRPNPDRKRIAAQARKLEQAMNQCQEQYRKMGSDMDIQP